MVLVLHAAGAKRRRRRRGSWRPTEKPRYTERRPGLGGEEEERLPPRVDGGPGRQGMQTGRGAASACNCCYLLWDWDGTACPRSQVWSWWLPLRYGSCLVHAAPLLRPASCGRRQPYAARGCAVADTCASPFAPSSASLSLPLLLLLVLHSARCRCPRALTVCAGLRLATTG